MQLKVKRWHARKGGVDHLWNLCVRGLSQLRRHTSGQNFKVERKLGAESGKVRIKVEKANVFTKKVTCRHEVGRVFVSRGEIITAA